MPLFVNTNNKLKMIKPIQLTQKKELKDLIEKNLDTLFNCSLLSSSFSMDSFSDDKIDTLALSNENNLVIIEYQVVEDTNVIYQSLYYLSLLKTQKDKFTQLVNELKSENLISVDWSTIRILCITPGFKKHDLFTVEQNEADIELWKFTYFDDASIALDDIYRKNKLLANPVDAKISQPLLKNEIPNEHIVNNVRNNRYINQSIIKNDNLVIDTKINDVKTNNSINFSAEKVLLKTDKEIVILVDNLNKFIMLQSINILKEQKYDYINYKYIRKIKEVKISQSFVGLHVLKEEVKLYLNLDPTLIKDIPVIGRDVTHINHCASGNFEITVAFQKDLRIAKEYIVKAYKNASNHYSLF